MSNMKNMEFLAWNREDEEFYKVDSIYFPLGKSSWKDISIETKDGLEWRGVDEVILLQNTGDLSEDGCKVYEVVVNTKPLNRISGESSLIQIPINATKHINSENQKTKGKDMRKLHLDRSNELVAEHLNNFTQWATGRQIIQNGNILAQGLKLVSEVGELADNLAKGRCTKDDIGDCLVVLNNLALMQGLTVEECMAHAWEDIKDRKGHMNEHGVFIKSGDTDGK